MKYLAVLLLLVCTCAAHVRQFPRGKPAEDGSNSQIVELRMPGIRPTKNDDYLCTAFNATSEENFITQFRIEGSAEKAHHMLLYGCEDIPTRNIYWDCGHHGVCSGGSSIMFAWAKNAPPTSLPPSVGFKFGGRTSVKYVVMQIHYSHPLPEGEKDYSGMDLEITKQQQKYLAGIYLLIGSATIPPFQPKVHADACCTVNTPATMHLFAYRTHAHGLGRVITGYRLSKSTGKLEQIAKGNPQWPQAFYGMSQVFEVETGDIISARCTYDSTNKNTTTFMGSTAGDEMCNLYLMYYTDSVVGKSYDMCGMMCGMPGMFPEGSDVPLPPNPLLEEHALHGSTHATNKTIKINDEMSINLEHMQYNVFDKENGEQGLIPEPEKKGHEHSINRKPGPIYPSVEDDTVDQEPVDLNNIDTGKPVFNNAELTKTYADNYVLDSKWLATIKSQPSAVALDSRGKLVVFHRGDRAWGFNTFDNNNRLTNPQDGPIKEPTLIMLNPSDSKILAKTGQNMFYLPHGLTIDHEDNLWITDVGSHQIFKLSPMKEGTSELQIQLELGKKLVPGAGNGEFCKPTSVAVMPSGEFFVADGYCNSRIIKFTKAGLRIAEWKAETRSPMNIPHSLALVPSKEMVCVADRENGRILCFSVVDGRLKAELKHPDFRSTIYAVAYKDGLLYAVNGPSASMGEQIPAQGFVIDIEGSGEIRSVFGTKINGRLGSPHGLAIASNGSSIYVAEIAPYRVVRLVPESTLGASFEVRSDFSGTKPTFEASSLSEKPTIIELDYGSFSPSVALSLIGIPVLLVVIIVSIVRLRKQGCCGKDRKRNSLDLGTLLSHRNPARGGFEKLAMEDSDGEGELDSDSDTDIVEFTKAKRDGQLRA